MPYLFIAAFVAWTAYRAAALTDFRASPLIARLSLGALGLDLVLMAASFAASDPWEAVEMTSHSGSAILFALVFNLFWLLGPFGNAALWGALGALCLKKTWDGGWYRAAIVMRRLEAEQAAKIAGENTRKAEASARARAWRSERFSRMGFAAGKTVRHLLGR